MTEIASTPRAAVRGQPLGDLAAGLGVVAFAILLAASDGFARLADAQGDNDSLLRLVQVRDLLAGQGWFDPVQSRMGLEGGFAMHWSRLVDAPLAVLMGLGESVALVAWPSLLMGAGAFLLLRMARLAHGPDAVFPALVVGALALVSIGIFEAGAIDHHNIQLVLTLGMGLGLIAGGVWPGLAAGACAALTLAIGMETLPYVAVGGAVAAGLFFARGEDEAAAARGFGLGFAAVGAAAFAATVPPSRWGAPACDAYSVAQASVAVLAGLGLAGLASVPALAGRRSRRLAALAVLAVLVGALVVLAFPQCLADPYAGLDPRLRRLWLDGVTEAQSVLSIARTDPAMLATWYATPLLALLVLAASALRGRAGRADAIVGALLVAAVLVSLWQVRGGVFAVALATVPLAGWIARRRAASARAASAGATLALALAWILSFNAVWHAAGTTLLGPPSSAGAGAGGASAARASGACYRGGDYAALAALPATTVLSVSNLGSAILAYTPHRVLSGPYHRNVAGNLAALDMLMAAPAAAEARLRAAQIGMVVVCPGNSETSLLVREAPGGLLAALVKGDTPAWLDPVETQAPLRLYRLRAP